ncbi:MAG: hypothetical protein ACRETF_10100 [Nevskiaceae bacterium]
MNDDTDRIEGLDQLTRARAPSRDLWPGIAARLHARRRSRYGLVQFTLAASLVAGMAAVFTLSLQQQPGGTAGAQTASLPLGDHSRAIVEAHLSIVKQAERELRQALKQHPESAPLRSLLASTENRASDLRAML